MCSDQCFKSASHVLHFDVLALLVCDHIFIYLFIYSHSSHLSIHPTFQQLFQKQATSGRRRETSSETLTERGKAGVELKLPLGRRNGRLIGRTSVIVQRDNGE